MPSTRPHTHTHTHTHTHIHISICISMDIYTYIDVRIHIYIYVLIASMPSTRPRRTTRKTRASTSGDLCFALMHLSVRAFFYASLSRNSMHTCIFSVRAFLHASLSRDSTGNTVHRGVRASRCGISDTAVSHLSRPGPLIPRPCSHSHTELMLYACHINRTETCQQRRGGRCCGRLTTCEEPGRRRAFRETKMSDDTARRAGAS